MKKYIDPIHHKNPTNFIGEIDQYKADRDDVLNSFGVTNTTVACYLLGLLFIGGIIGVIIMHFL